MTRELRRIWSEDQYTFLGAGFRMADEGIKYRDTSLYFGRIKGENFLVYRKFPDRRGTKLVQQVSLEADWFWDADSQKLVGDSALARATDASKGEHILSGHFCNVDEVQMRTSGLADLSPFVKIRDDKLKTGAVATWLQPLEPRRWVVSLHGGPDSYESLEIRYGGLYRELLREHTGVIILNYVGSKGLPKPRCGWKQSIQDDFQSLLELARSYGISKSDITIMGASFGGALALILHRLNELAHTVAVSPLLDLAEQRGRGAEDHAAWFRQNFGSNDEVDLSFESLTDIQHGFVSITYGTNDEVLGKRVFERLQKRAETYPRLRPIAEVRGHVPVTYRATRTQFENLRSALSV